MELRHIHPTGGKKASLEKNRGISGVNGFAAFLTEDRERKKQNSVMLLCIYLQSCIF